MSELSEIEKITEILKNISNYDYKVKNLVRDLFLLGYDFSCKPIQTNTNTETHSFKAVKTSEVIVISTNGKVD